ncbi:hypothetical protein [Streptomyces mexicanus]|uniref:hypothetical protein n=1 Tax=Streptomyces mexicanus TaxID=178566 RepID=UPI0036613A6E
MRTTADRLVVRPAWWEQVAVQRREVCVPLAAVRRVTVEPDWWRALRGSRRSGVQVPGVLYVGVRAHQSGRDFVVLRPGRPVVCVELWPGAAFSLLAVSAPGVRAAEATAAALRRAAPRLDSSTPYRQPLPVPEEPQGQRKPQGADPPGGSGQPKPARGPGSADDG